MTWCNLDVRKMYNAVHYLYTNYFVSTQKVPVTGVLQHITGCTLNSLEEAYVRILLGIPIENSKINYELYVSSVSVHYTTLVLQCINSFKDSCYTLSLSQIINDCINTVKSINNNLFSLRIEVCVAEIICDCLRTNIVSLSNCFGAERAQAAYCGKTVTYAHLLNYETDSKIRILPAGMCGSITAWQALHSRDALLRHKIDSEVSALVYESNNDRIFIHNAKVVKQDNGETLRDNCIQNTNITSQACKDEYSNNEYIRLMNKFAGENLHYIPLEKLQSDAHLLYIKIVQEYVSLATILSNLDVFKNEYHLTCSLVYVKHMQTGGDVAYTCIPGCIYDFDYVKQNQEITSAYEEITAKSNSDVKLKNTPEEKIGFTCMSFDEKQPSDYTNSFLSALQTLFK